jgi:hypothetical protein
MNRNITDESFCYFKPTLDMPQKELEEVKTFFRNHRGLKKGEYVREALMRSIREDVARATGKSGCLDSIQARELAEVVGKR